MPIKLYKRKGMIERMNSPVYVQDVDDFYFDMGFSQFLKSDSLWLRLGDSLAQEEKGVSD